MARKPTSMDGFVPRRSERRVGGTIGGEKPAAALPRPQLSPQISVSTPVAPKASEPKLGLRRSEIDDSLNGIDEEDNKGPSRGRKIKTPGQKSNRRKWIKRIALLIVVILIAIGAYVGIKAVLATGNVFKGNILDVFQNAPLKQDSNGRSNIIVVGTSEDDPGHQGGTLTDSMMIVSIDQNKKNAFLVSIPRDLYVKYGVACNSGYAGKINEYYGCVHDGDGVKADQDALAKEASFVGEIAGLDIQYGVNVNYTVMRDLVNAVGGSITVNIEGDGPTPTGIPAGSVMDSNFDWKCGVGDRKVTRAQVLQRCPTRGHFIDYPPGPATLDAEHALYLAQARGDAAPTWGLAQSNFDREKNQQKIIVALKDKATSAGVLTNFTSVTSILDSLGNNLRVTFETKEIRTLASLLKDIKSSDIQSISLIDGDNPVMTTGNVSGMSVVEPAAGTYDYSDLRALLQQKFSSDPVVREGAPIAVLNGSGTPGVAQTEADKLTDAKYIVSSVANAPTATYPHYTLYKIGDGDSGTQAALEKLYGIKVTAGSPPVAVGSTIKFVLIVGPEPSSGSASSN